MAKGWSKRTARQHTKERNTDLREHFPHNLSYFQSYHLVYIVMRMNPDVIRALGLGRQAGHRLV